MKSWSKLVLVGLLSLAGVPAAQATVSKAGGDEGHGSAVPMDFTPTVSIGGDRPTSPFVSGVYNHQVPLRVLHPGGVLLTVGASAVAWAPTFAGSHPNQKVTGRLLAWSASSVLTCATAGTTWNQSGSPSNQSIGSCSIDPSQQRVEAEFGIGTEMSQAKATYPRLFSVGYQF